MKKKGISQNVKKGLLYSTIFLSTLNGCKKNNLSPSPSPTPTDTTSISYYDNTHEIKGNIGNNIVSYNDSVISFSNASELKKGEIIYSEGGKNFPNGFLKEIKKIDGNKVYVENSNLEKLIKKGNIHFQKKLTSKDLEGRLKNTNLSKDYNFHKKISQIIYDADGNEQTQNDQIKVYGDFYFDLELGIDAKFNQGLKVIEATSNIEGELDLNLKGNVDKKIDWQKDFLNLKFTPIVIAPGVVAVPKFESYLYFNGQANGEFDFGTTIKNQNNQVLEYNKGEGWSRPVNKNNFDFEKKKPLLELITNSKGGIGERASLLLYGVAGPFVEAREYLRLHSDIDENPWWKLFGGLELNLGLDPGLFSGAVNTYSATLLKKENLLIEADPDSKKPYNTFELISDDGTSEEDYNLMAKRDVNTNDFFETFARKKAHLDKIPYYLDEVDIYFKKEKGNGKYLYVDIEKPEKDSLIQRVLLNTDTMHFPKWYKLKLDGTKKLYIKDISVDLGYPYANGNPSPLDASMILGIDKDNNEGLSESTKAHVTDWSIKDETKKIDGEFLIRLKGHQK